MNRWRALEARVHARTEKASSNGACLDEIQIAGRTILRAFSGSFFLVTRFLPTPKRGPVEMIYAAVRYPDEIVDTFPLSKSAKLGMLDEWQRGYESAMAIDNVRDRLSAGVPSILAGFAEVAQQTSIPPEHYRTFLDAMRRDVAPQPFSSLEDLIEHYIFGSAIVVGYFLAHVYGAAAGCTHVDTYRCSADLGVALQLTNFARDIAEDAERGRVYVPEDLARAAGLRGGAVLLAEEAERRYQTAAQDVAVFAPDTQPAIRACIDVYRRLNRRILSSRDGAAVRHSVPIREKFSALPPAKYWRVPLAFLGGL